MTESASGSLALLTTPEGVIIPFETAPPGSRLLAFLVDLLAIAGILAGVGLSLFLLLGAGQAWDSLVIGAFLLFSFLLVNFYFILAELRMSGRTPGKKAFGLRVVARDGGPLTAEMVMARNLTRSVELFLPIQILLLGPDLIGLGGSIARLGALLWCGLFLLVPVFGHQRRRLGDIVAGTLVVLSPRPVLLPDVTESEPGGTEEMPSYVFTVEHLDIYGAYELQVLEKVLRANSERPERGLLIQICRKVQQKIDWPEDRRDVDPEAFLRAFYAAQRNRLEREMILGRRRERKRF